MAPPRDISGRESSARETSGSGPRLPLGLTSEIEARLHKTLGHLEWLDARLTQPSAEASLDDSRERARALMVVAEARVQLQQAFEQVKRGASTVPPLPTPPKLPTI